jgi:hypothetical protein
MCGFIPKCHSWPVRPCFISGPRVAAAFFELGAAMIVASTIVPALSSSRCSGSSPAIASHIAVFKWCASSRCRNRRIVVSSGTTSSPNSIRANRRIDSLS